MSPLSQLTIVGKLTTSRSPLACGIAVPLMTFLAVLAFSSAPAAQAEAPCPNEALRTELNSSWLPECRAYEMVSPPYKEGYPLFLSSYAAGGERAILYSLANLAGAEGTGENVLQANVYLDQRDAGGWQLTPLNASSSEFVGQRLVAAEADDGMTLWDQHTPHQGYGDRGLYVRSAAGVFSFIGPLQPPSLVEEEPSNALRLDAVGEDEPFAATSDYGHVVMDGRGGSEAYWSFDRTQGINGSLYEYSGTGNQQPVLVAVSGSKGSTQLLGLCSARLGGSGVNSESSSFNALSADGESVFFTVLPGVCGAPTPATAEVYGRLHGALSSPLAAETVHVSASECTALCGGESGKNFEGASEDGKTVYFTSTQKLTDDAADNVASGDATEGAGCAGTPGEAGCNLYKYDFEAPEGERLTVAENGDVLGVVDLAENGQRVYFVSHKEIPGSGENVYGKTPIAEESNLYVYDNVNGKTTFIATLAESDSRDWQREFERPVQVTGEDGRFLLFASRMKGLTPHDETSKNQLFEYDAVSGELVRVSKGEEGYNANGNGGTETLQVGPVETHSQTTDFKSSVNERSISVDGQTVFFSSKDRLSARAVSAEAGCRNIYEFHAGAGGVLEQGSVHLVSDGRDTQDNKGLSCGAEFQKMDDSGGDLLFTTADPLIPSDVDSGQRDVYDARVAGGFPPTLTGEASCGGAGCEGSTSAPPPLFGAPSSSGLTGAGNLAPPPPAPAAKAKAPAKRQVSKCPKGKKLSHGKCVKPVPKKQVRAKKATTKTNRRTGQ